MNSPAATIAPASGQVKSAVVFLHGYGSNAEDLISLAPYFAPTLPDTLFISPNAPFPCELGPYGYQWFSLQNRREDVMWGEVKQAAPLLEAIIAGIQAEYDLPLGKIALVGFSQGTMMSLHVAPRLNAALAGVVGFSGALMGPDNLAHDIKSRPPVLLVHGTADEVVPYAALAVAEAALKANQVAVQTVSCPGLGHGIDENGLHHAQNFLREKLL